MDFRSLVDDFEMYDQQKPFSLEDLTALSGFLNTLTYKLLWNKSTNKREIFIHLKLSISKYILNFSFFSFYSRCESLFCFISFTIASYLPVKCLLRSISFHSLSSTLYQFYLPHLISFLSSHFPSDSFLFNLVHFHPSLYIQLLYCSWHYMIVIVKLISLHRVKFSALFLNYSLI